jgi:hypothetical protein
MRLPCGCVLKSSTIIIHTQNMYCENITQLIVELHPLNLPKELTFKLPVLPYTLDYGHSIPMDLALPNFSQIFEDMPEFSNKEASQAFGIDALKTQTSHPAVVMQPTWQVSMHWHDPGISTTHKECMTSREARLARLWS